MNHGGFNQSNQNNKGNKHFHQFQYLTLHFQSSYLFNLFIFLSFQSSYIQIVHSSNEKCVSEKNLTRPSSLHLKNRSYSIAEELTIILVFYAVCQQRQMFVLIKCSNNCICDGISSHPLSHPTHRIIKRERELCQLGSGSGICNVLLGIIILKMVIC